MKIVLIIIGWLWSLELEQLLLVWWVCWWLLCKGKYFEYHSCILSSDVPNEVSESDGAFCAGRSRLQRPTRPSWTPFTGGGRSWHRVYRTTGAYSLMSLKIQPLLHVTQKVHFLLLLLHSDCVMFLSPKGKRGYPGEKGETVSRFCSLYLAYGYVTHTRTKKKSVGNVVFSAGLLQYIFEWSQGWTGPTRTTSKSLTIYSMVLHTYCIIIFKQHLKD